MTRQLVKRLSGGIGLGLLLVLGVGVVLAQRSGSDPNAERADCVWAYKDGYSIDLGRGILRSALRHSSTISPSSRWKRAMATGAKS